MLEGRRVQRGQVSCRALHIAARWGTEVIDNCWLCRFMALRWLNLPCAVKAAIGYGKRTLGDSGQSDPPRGPQQGSTLSPVRAPTGSGGR